jgi:hypothetical protein
MENKSFTTETDAKYAKMQFFRPALITMIGTMTLSLLGLIVSPGLVVMLEITQLFCLGIIYYTTLRKCSWRLFFENDQLTLTNLTTGQTFSVWDIPASDIVIKQSEKEKELDYGFVTIKDTVFGFHGVRNCNALREYIKENYR